jgi:hypothetical protein
MSNLRFSNFPNGITQSMQVERNDYSQTIIKPPEPNVTQGRITRKFIVLSRERDLVKYPNSNRYRINVPQEWRDVVSASLIEAIIPNTYYNINESNFNFYIQEIENELNTIQIPEGQYSNQLLLDVLNGNHGDLFISLMNKYNFSQNPVNKKLRIQSNRATGFDFIYNINHTTNTSCSPCRIDSVDFTIGFTNQTYTSSEIDLSYISVAAGGITNTGTTSDQDYNVYKLVSSGVDFTSVFYVNDYFILNDGLGNTYSCQVYQIKNDKTIYFEDLSGSPAGTITALSGNIFQNISILISPNIYQLEIEPVIFLRIKDFWNFNSVSDGAENSYAILPLFQNFFSNTVINSSTLPYGGITKFFNPPLPRLPFIDIEFVTANGQLFDFRGQENTLVFEFTLLNQPNKYNY